MARRARCWRVRSALTRKVKVIEAVEVNAHAAFPRVTSGQLPFLGSMTWRDGAGQASTAAQHGTQAQREGHGTQADR